MTLQNAAINGTRITITGEFRRNRCRKRRSSNWMTDFAFLLAEEAGTVPAQYHPDMVWVTVPGVADNGRGLIYKIPPRCQKPVEEIKHGEHVTLSGVVDLWENGLGGYLKRVQVLSRTPVEAMQS